MKNVDKYLLKRCTTMRSKVEKWNQLTYLCNKTSLIWLSRNSWVFAIAFAEKKILLSFIKIEINTKSIKYKNKINGFRWTFELWSNKFAQLVNYVHVYINCNFMFMKGRSLARCLIWWNLWKLSFYWQTLGNQ